MSIKDKFLDLKESVKNKASVKVDELWTKYISNTNFFSNLGTIWTQSTSAFAGITESVITPGFRMIKWVTGIMQVYKKLQYNITTIQNRLTRVTNRLNSFSTGEYDHVRNSVIKRKVNNK